MDKRVVIDIKNDSAFIEYNRARDKALLDGYFSLGELKEVIKRVEELQSNGI